MEYIGAATLAETPNFDKDKNSPIASWKVNASLGGIDIADDGSFIAAGGTDKKLYILTGIQNRKQKFPLVNILKRLIFPRTENMLRPVRAARYIF